MLASGWVAQLEDEVQSPNKVSLDWTGNSRVLIGGEDLPYYTDNNREMRTHAWWHTSACMKIMEIFQIYTDDQRRVGDRVHRGLMFLFEDYRSASALPIIHIRSWKDWRIKLGQADNDPCQVKCFSDVFVNVWSIDVAHISSTSCRAFISVFSSQLDELSSSR